jgi:hypothetical protein
LPQPIDAAVAGLQGLGLDQITPGGFGVVGLEPALAALGEGPGQVQHQPMMAAVALCRRLAQKPVGFFEAARPDRLLSLP